MDTLVRERKACRLCPGLTNPSCVREGALDSDQLGPWTLWQGRIDAEILVVGQDWGDVASFERNLGFEEPGNPTNQRLIELLSLAGVEVTVPTKLGRAGTAFFTNAILCLKTGGLQGRVEPRWFESCGVRFLRRTIDTVSPRAVVGLGVHATTAICGAYEIKPPRRFAVAVADVGIALPGGPTLFPRYHCGARSTNMNRSREKQDEDWRRIGSWLAKLRDQGGL